MQTWMSHKCWLAGISLIVLAGCSMSRRNLARNGEDRPEFQSDQSADTKTADAGNADADGPPSQPGVRKPGDSRKKLAGWLSNASPKRESIPLDRTDSDTSEDSDESVAEGDSGFWKHTDTTPVGDDSKLAKSQSADVTKGNLFEE